MRGAEQTDASDDGYISIYRGEYFEEQERMCNKENYKVVLGFRPIQKTVSSEFCQCTPREIITVTPCSCFGQM